MAPLPLPRGLGNVRSILSQHFTSTLCSSVDCLQHCQELVGGSRMPFVPSLRQLATSTLIRYRDCLGDVGDAPLELLADVLASCSPAQLAEIEDATLQGSGRCLTPWLWPHWRQLFIAAFGEPTGSLPLLPAAAEVAAGAGPPADYRCAAAACAFKLALCFLPCGYGQPTSEAPITKGCSLLWPAERCMSGTGQSATQNLRPAGRACGHCGKRRSERGRRGMP
jgi:hypothetical protein